MPVDNGEASTFQAAIARGEYDPEKGWIVQ